VVPKEVIYVPARVIAKDWVLFKLQWVAGKLSEGKRDILQLFKIFYISEGRLAFPIPLKFLRN
jgi:hypothetical protein